MVFDRAELNRNEPGAPQPAPSAETLPGVIEDDDREGARPGPACGRSTQLTRAVHVPVPLPAPRGTRRADAVAAGEALTRLRLAAVDDRLQRAKERLDRLDWWPRACPDRARQRSVVAPWFFRLPWLSRFDGYAFHNAILLRSADVSDDLVVHELCHVWQMQHRPLRMPLSYLGTGYAANQYERQARAAAAATR